MGDKIVDYLINKKAISSNNRELYAYAVQCLFSLLYPIAFAMVVGAIFEMVVESVLMIIPFIWIRKFAGGFHANSFRKCLILSSMVITSVLLLANNIDNDIVLNVIYIVSNMLLCILSPIDSENKRLNMEDKKFCKKVIIFTTGILMLCVESLWLCGYRHSIKFVEMGVILAEIMQIIAKLL